MVCACVFAQGCKASGSAPATNNSATPPLPTASATEKAPSAVVAPKPAPKPASTVFGPDIRKTAIEGVNGNTGYLTNQPQHAIDGNLATAWAASAATHPWLEVAFLPGTTVDGIEMAGQRGDSAVKNYWTGDSVITRARILWDGGEGELEFNASKDKGVKKKLAIGAITRRVRIEVLSTHPGSQSDDINIDELRIFGTAPTSPAPDPKGLTGVCRAGRAALRFNRGAFVGGEWVDGPESSWLWTFSPISARVDDNDWHTLGIRYLENATIHGDGTVTIHSRNTGKFIRFRASAEGFETDEEGAKNSGKCTVE